VKVQRNGGPGCSSSRRRRSRSPRAPTGARATGRHTGPERGGAFREVGVVGEHPTAMAPRADRVGVQPAPQGGVRGGKVDDVQDFDADPELIDEDDPDFRTQMFEPGRSPACGPRIRAAKWRRRSWRRSTSWTRRSRGRRQEKG
jgi:hypothetical protein